MNNTIACYMCHTIGNVLRECDQLGLHKPARNKRELSRVNRCLLQNTLTPSMIATKKSLIFPLNGHLLLTLIQSCMHANIFQDIQRSAVGNLLEWKRASSGYSLPNSFIFIYASFSWNLFSPCVIYSPPGHSTPHKYPIIPLKV